MGEFDMVSEMIHSQSDHDKLLHLLSEVSPMQLQYIQVRLDAESDAEAARVVGLPVATVRGWIKKGVVDEIIRLLRLDSLAGALAIRKRNLAKAMLVKVSGLESRNEKIRQQTATELVEWELGKAVMKGDLTTRSDNQARIMNVQRAIDKVYLQEVVDELKEADPDA